MSLSKVLELARAELGTTEDPPGSNLTKYGFWYGVDGVPWCVIFLCWLFNQAGERMAFFGGGKTASCGMLLRWYREQGLTVPVSGVQPGDIVLLNFHGGKDPEHCGLITHVERSGGSILYVKSIEGNTYAEGGSGDDSNGGCVAERTRYPRNIVGVARPKYKPDDPQPVDDVTGNWAESAIRWCMAHDLLQGYPDGSFGPDKPVTRAELATVLRRLILVEDDGK